MGTQRIHMPCAKAFDAETLAYLGDLGLDCSGPAIRPARPAPAPAMPEPAAQRPLRRPASAPLILRILFCRPIATPLRKCANGLRNLSLLLRGNLFLDGLRITLQVVGWLVAIAAVLALAALAVALVWCILALAWVLFVKVVLPLFGLLMLLCLIGCFS
jgi:hypothetical protein